MRGKKLWNGECRLRNKQTRDGNEQDFISSQSTIRYWQFTICITLTLALSLTGRGDFKTPYAYSYQNGTPSQALTLSGITTITGQQAAQLLQQPIATIRVYAFHGERLEPTPFQIDERDHRDRWVLDHGSQSQQDDSPGVFDDNDVLVLMDRDLGQRGEPARLPTGATAWAEVRVGSATSAVGFAYIGVFATTDAKTGCRRSDPSSSVVDPHPSPLPARERGIQAPQVWVKVTTAESTTDGCSHIAIHTPYTRYDPQADFVRTDRYTLGFAGAPLPSHLAFVNQLGENATNLIAGIRVIGEVRFLRGLLTLRRTDQDIQTEVLGYRHGPIRTIRRARYWIPLPLGFRTNGRIDIAFYRDIVEGTTTVRLKVPPRLILADGELQAYFRFLALSGARLIVEGLANTSVVDGHMDDTEQARHQRPARWAALALPNGRTLLLIARLEGSLQRLEQRLYFADNHPETPESGTSPHFGFEFSRVNQLETGTHRLSVFAITLDSTRIEDVHHTVELFLTPPEVHVTPIPQSSESLERRDK
ncbi:MAG: hypothetical protein FJ147_19660 [Deltaproteobacteria bacterium]|nr:hypothetical protein [Deltaproteobacteria bacterium]